MRFRNLQYDFHPWFGNYMYVSIIHSFQSDKGQSTATDISQYQYMNGAS